MSADRLRGLPLAIAATAVLVLAAAGGETNDFMPKGGRALLVDIAGSSSSQLREIAAAKRTEEEWLDFARKQPKLATDRERATLAAYLAVNMPLADATQGAPVLPPDGRDLAWEGCQSCHSLFSSFLTQQGSATRWRNMFLAPFHRNIRMTPQQREEFARYAEINMPMRVEDVPQELRY
jgi:hypothetical protein